MAEPGGHQRQAAQAGLAPREAHEERTGEHKTSTTQEKLHCFGSSHANSQNFVLSWIFFSRGLFVVKELQLQILFYVALVIAERH